MVKCEMPFWGRRGWCQRRRGEDWFAGGLGEFIGSGCRRGVGLVRPGEGRELKRRFGEVVTRSGGRVRWAAKGMRSENGQGEDALI